MSIGYILEEEKAMHMWNCMGFLIFCQPWLGIWEVLQVCNYSMWTSEWKKKESLEHRGESDGNIGSYHNVIPNHKKVYLFA